MPKILVSNQALRVSLEFTGTISTFVGFPCSCGILVSDSSTNSQNSKCFHAGLMLVCLVHSGLVISRRAPHREIHHCFFELCLQHLIIPLLVLIVTRMY